MATTYQEISKHLDTLGLKYDVKEDKWIRVGFQTKSYRDTDGDEGIGIVIVLEENGEFIKFFTPMAFKYKDGPHREAIFQTCLVISLRTKGAQFEYDPNDGEIRMILEFPLEDNDLTANQLQRCIHLLVGIAENYYEVMMKAINDGEAATLETDTQSRAAAIAQLEALLARMKADAGVEGDGETSGGTDLGIDL
ncbi:CesT family type III secretion system chaperone [Stieleria varia]|uniref:YbjN domain-containing protein n=1 Tax=Stieleria varia TaxID=2528005 RepID=A0A5C6B2M4_9BACT|nr:CesT family type III secretion system chaperone [Stieleria varia]TWU06150.1 hypothetical protein Pla52n_18700 [Stieleria varia]